MTNEYWEKIQIGKFTITRSKDGETWALSNGKGSTLVNLSSLEDALEGVYFDYTHEGYG